MIMQQWGILMEIVIFFPVQDFTIMIKTINCYSRFDYYEKAEYRLAHFYFGGGYMNWIANG